MSEPLDYQIGSGNVFADLGLPDAEAHQVKARLVQKIDAVMRERGLTQAATADLLGVAHQDLSGMLRGRFRGMPVETLLRHLVALGQDVEIVVRSPRDPGQPAQLNVA